MKRRSLLRAAAALPAAGLLRAQQPVVPPQPAPAAMEEIPVIESTIPDTAAATVASYFSPEQFATLRRLSDLIAPAMQGAPGAMEAEAPEFLDFLIGESPADRQTLYRTGLDELNDRAQQQFEAPFARLTAEQADRVLAPLRAAWTVNPDPVTQFLRTAKQDILQATQNSHTWIREVSKRERSAGGLGMYWLPIE
ncbi:MAG TPA: gluconate 2-dehydrogenase subunit 3 family protein [Bryobacteraceae bacterium]